jgi:hypothetical protein
LTYDGFWLYHEAQKVASAGSDYDGRVGRAGLTSRARGPRVVKDGKTFEALGEGSRPTAGLLGGRLLTASVGGLTTSTSPRGAAATPLTRMPGEGASERLWKEDGEVGRSPIADTQGGMQHDHQRP